MHEVGPLLNGGAGVLGGSASNDTMGTVLRPASSCSASNSGDILLAERELAVSVRDRSWLARFKINATNVHNLLVFHHPSVANLASKWFDLESANWTGPPEYRRRGHRVESRSPLFARAGPRPRCGGPLTTINRTWYVFQKFLTRASRARFSVRFWPGLISATWRARGAKER